MAKHRDPIIPCKLNEATKKLIDDYVADLKQEAHQIGSHGLSKEEFWQAKIFHSAIEQLRGTQAASMSEKRAFIGSILDDLLNASAIREWKFSGAKDRHDYEVITIDNRVAVIEAKGCLDGNNTTIFQRPSNADEFYIWSLCQNPGSDPDKNAWSGIHTRLGAEVIHRKQIVDGVIIWDMLCGSAGRPCPKVAGDNGLGVLVGARRIPPPCLYLFPRSIPDARNNPNPPTWEVDERSFLTALFDRFHMQGTDIVKVNIEVQIKNSDIERRTKFTRNGFVEAESKWTVIQRAR